MLVNEFPITVDPVIPVLTPESAPITVHVLYPEVPIHVRDPIIVLSWSFIVSRDVPARCPIIIFAYTLDSSKRVFFPLANASLPITTLPL